MGKPADLTAPPLTEADIRKIVREEIQSALLLLAASVGDNTKKRLVDLITSSQKPKGG